MKRCIYPVTNQASMCTYSSFYLTFLTLFSLTERFGLYKILCPELTKEDVSVYAW